MTTAKLKKLYAKKKRVLDEAEVRVRKALIHSRREANLESTILYHVENMQKAHGELSSNIDLMASGKAKPQTQAYIAKELTDALNQLAVLQHKVRSMLSDLRHEKVEGYKNTKSLMRHFKELNVLREKMDKHLA